MKYSTKLIGTFKNSPRGSENDSTRRYSQIIGSTNLPILESDQKGKSIKHNME